MKRSLTFFVLLGALVSGPGAWTQQGPPADEPVAEVVSAWFVELQGRPQAKGGSAPELARERELFRAAARAAGVQLRERYSFDRLWNGLSVEVSATGLSRLTTLPEVKNVFPVAEVGLPEPEPVPAPALETALAMTQADIARSELGLTGQGIRVAIIDSGVDYDHPDLGGCFGPGCRVEGGWDFVGDAYDATTNPVPVPDPLPDDCNGHGTHVAGILGADGGIEGVAPGVTFRVYKVFGCVGATGSDVLLAAMERVLQDGADVLNMSVGAGFQWPQFPTSVAADALVDAGIVVAAAAGNNGLNGLYAAGAPGVGDKVMAVANFVNSHANLPVFTVSPDDLPIGYAQALPSPPAPLAGTFPLARTGTASSTNDACNSAPPLPPGSLAGKVALVRRGTCSFHEKARNARNAGAAAVVIYNDAPPLQTITVPGVPLIDVPVVSISGLDGVALDGRLAAGPVDLTWTSELISVPNANGNVISPSSSYGVAPDLTLKPDLGAPGNPIRSTVPVEQGSYASMIGTSMSSPQVAGAAALLLEARPGTPANTVRTLLQNYASPRLWGGNPALGLLDNVHRQGSGMLRIADAVRATATVEPVRLSLGESEAGPAVRTLTVRNDGPAAVTYDLSHQPALATGPSTFTPSFLNAPATVALSAASLTVPAGGTASLEVTIAPNAALPDRCLYGGYLVLAPQGGGTAMRVPFAGFKGDYQALQVLTPTANGFPWLAKRTGGVFTKQPAGATYTLQGDDVPFILVHLDHQARRLVMEVRDAATGEPVHPFFHDAFADDYLPRNATPGGFFAIAWDGTRLHSEGNHRKAKEVPDGRYVIVLEVLKALGDPEDPAHRESWVSPVITLDRP